MVAGLSDDCGRVALLELAHLVEVLVTVGAGCVADCVVEVYEGRGACGDARGTGGVGLSQVTGFAGCAFRDTQITVLTAHRTAGAFPYSIINL